MIDRVDKELKKWRTTPFEYGVCDCLLSIADYCLPALQMDWGAEFRGRYTDEPGALAFVDQYGSPEALIDRSGMKRTDAPKRGDVIVFEAFPGVKIPGICTGDSVAARMENGTKEIRIKFVKIVAAWSVPNVE